MTEFVDNNNAEMNNLEREQCLLNGEVSLTEEIINYNVDSTEEMVEEENDVQLPAEWITGSWENQKYPFNFKMSDPPIEPHTPLEYFKQLFDLKIIENIVYQTNLYYVQRNGNKKTHYQHSK